MLGSAVCEHFSHNKSLRAVAVGGSNNSFIQAEKYLVGDLTQQNFIESLAEFEFDAVVHCAALTDIEKCESEPEIARRINAAATENLAKMFPKSLFVYISTDSVFDGKTGNYGEEDKTNPLNVYAQTKLAGEKALANINENHYIIRTNMYGFHRPPSGRSLFEWSFERLSGGNQVSGFTNVIFNPSYVGQLAGVIEQKFNLSECSK